MSPLECHFRRGRVFHFKRDTLSYFTARPDQAKRDSDFALDYVRRHALTPAEQESVLAALRFKCDVLWVQLDALWGAYVAGAEVGGGRLKREAPARTI